VANSYDVTDSKELFVNIRNLTDENTSSALAAPSTATCA
jgi:hypothetical protein